MHHGRMTVTPAAAQKRLTDQVADEIAAWLGRLRWSQARLARALGQSPMWVSDRLNGNVEIGLTDVERIADVMGLQPGDLLPQRARERSIAQSIRRPKTSRYGAVRTILTSPRPADRNTPATAKMTMLAPSGDGRARRLPA